MENKYIKQYRETTGRETERQYSVYVQRFFEYKGVTDITQQDINDVTVEDANKYADYLADIKGFKNATVNKHLKALNSFYRYMSRRDIGIAEYNPFSTIEGAKRMQVAAYDQGTRITDENLKMLNDYFSSDRSIMGTRNYIIFLILASTGIRRAEVCHIKVGDFFQYGNQYGMRYIGKGSKPNMVAIGTTLKALIDEYIQRQCWDYTMKDQYMFPSQKKFYEPITPKQIWRVLKEAAEKTNIDQDITTHDFRHTYVTKSLEMGASIYDVSNRVGHSSVAVTKRYDHSNRIFVDNPADDILEELMDKERGQILHLVV